MTVFYDSIESVFKLADSGDTLRDISPYVESIEGLPGEWEMIPVTSFADSGEVSVKGQQKATITIVLVYSADATVGPDTILRPLYDHTAVVAFEYYPIGTASGKPKYSGNVWLEKYPIATKKGELLTTTITLRVVDGVTTGVVP